MQDYFLNTAYEGIGRNEATVFTKEQVEKYSEFDDKFALSITREMFQSQHGKMENQLILTDTGMLATLFLL